MALAKPVRVLGMGLTFAVAAAGCVAPGEEGGRTPPDPFAEDVLIAGRVLENSTACEVDAVCFLRIEFADASVVALYGTGERPAPPCEISRDVSDAAFPVQNGEVISVVISRCADEGYYILQDLVVANAEVGELHSRMGDAESEFAKRGIALSDRPQGG